MKITSLHIKNFRCFEDLKIEFNTGNSNTGGLTVLVAKNGEGKTTVLDALNIAYGPFITKLTKERDRYLISADDNYLSPTGVLTEYASIEACIENPELFYNRYGHKNFCVKRYFDGLKQSTKTEDHYHLTNLARHIYDWRNEGEPWPLFGYYGEQRLVGIPDIGDIVEKDSSFVADRLLGYKNARQPVIGYKYCLKWFRELSLWEFGERMKQEENDSSFDAEFLEQMQEQLRLLKDALRQVMFPAGYTEISYSAKYKELVCWNPHSEFHSSRIPVSRLSAGIRTTLGMIIDMIYRCIKLNPQLGKDCLKATPGIIMIDEIELALHPAWQQQILPALQCIFPKVQFIVTTHSPQVVSSVPSECVRVIANGEIFNAPIKTEGARVDQILFDIFGVSARYANSEVTKALAEYELLINQNQWDSIRGKELWAKIQRDLSTDPILAKLAMRVHLKEYQRAQNEKN